MINLIQSILSLYNPAPARAMAAAETVDQHEELKAGAIALATPAELQLTQSAIQLVERDEGDRLTAYPDPATGGTPWTIGYGHTGPDVTPGLVITETQAQALLASDLHKFDSGVLELLDNGMVSTSDDEYSAMVSLAYNIGLGNFAKSSVLRLHKNGQFPEAADAFLLWDMAAGKVMAGLVRRRHQERELYLDLTVDQ
jgi:lysozyme